MKEKDELAQLQALDAEGRLTEKGKEYMQTLERKISTQGDPGFLARQAIFAGKGALDLPRGVKQRFLQLSGPPGAAEEYTERVNRELDMYRPLAERHPIESMISEAGGAAGMGGAVPVLGRSGVGRMGSAAGLGAAEGLATFAPTGSAAEIALNTILGGAGGVLGQALGEGVGLVGNRVRRALRSRRQPSPDVAPEMVSPEMTEEVPRTGQIPAQYGYRTEEFQIPLTEGLATGKSRPQMREQRMMRGAYGPGKEQQLNELLAYMEAGREQAYRRVQTGATGQPVMPRYASGQELARDMSEAARELYSNVDEAFDYARAHRAGLGMEDTYRILNELRALPEQSDLRSEMLTPNTHEFLRVLDTFVPEVGSDQQLVGMDAENLHVLRQTLDGFIGASRGNANDMRVLRGMKSHLDDSILELMQQGRLTGDPTGVQAMREGIKLRADYGRLYGPRLKRTKSGRWPKDPVGERIEQLVEAPDVAVAAQDFDNWLWGGQALQPRNTNPAKVAARLEDAYGRDSPEFGLFKSSFFQKLHESIQNPRTGQISPQKFRKIWRQLRQNPASLNAILTAEERDTVGRLVREVGQTEYRPEVLNPSGTAHMLEGMAQDYARRAQAEIGAAIGGLPGYAAMDLAGRVAANLRRAFGRRVFEPVGLAHAGLARSAGAQAALTFPEGTYATEER